MAKPFYSMEEVCAKLGKKPEAVRELVRDGKLREFRDAGKIFFKAEDVDQLAGPARSAGDSGEILLEAAEEPAPAHDEPVPSLKPSTGGTSIIGLEPIGEEEKDKKKEDTAITAGGISVFGDDELEIDADPMAKTQITAGAVDDQVSLESSGSGSGLLDLTRESDDTSLGAELLDEIYPGEEETAPAAKAPVAKAEPKAKAKPEPEPEPELAEADAGEVLAPVIVATGDPTEGAFSGLLVGALIVLTVASAVVGGVIQGYLPDYATLLTKNFWFFLPGSFLVAIIALAIGWFVGRATSGRK